MLRKELKHVQVRGPLPRMLRGLSFVFCGSVAPALITVFCFFRKRRGSPAKQHDPSHHHCTNKGLFEMFPKSTSGPTGRVDTTVHGASQLCRMTSPTQLFADIRNIRRNVMFVEMMAIKTRSLWACDRSVRLLSVRALQRDPNRVNYSGVKVVI